MLPGIKPVVFFVEQLKKDEYILIINLFLYGAFPMKKELTSTHQTTRRNFLKTCGKGALIASLPVGTGVVTGCANQQGVEKADTVFKQYQPGN